MMDKNEKWKEKYKKRKNMKRRGKIRLPLRTMRREPEKVKRKRVKCTEGREKRRKRKEIKMIDQ